MRFRFGWPAQSRQGLSAAVPLFGTRPDARERRQARLSRPSALLRRVTVSVLQPSDAKQTAEAIAWAAAEGGSLEIVAGGTKRALGRYTRTDHILDVSRLTGITNYEAAELVLTARPGEPLAAINAELVKKRQMLAFEPPDWRALLGAEGEQTLGGVIACNMAGSRRVRAGAARDYVLGFTAVNGFGDIWKAGGKVVKNVTGYDMCKLQAGAYGTLSALTEITIKVMPKPETACTIVLHGLADEVAIPVLANALNSPFEVSGAAHLPASAARRSKVSVVAAGLGPAAGMGLEGPRPRDGYALGRPAAVSRLSDHSPRIVGRARRASQRGGD